MRRALVAAVAALALPVAASAQVEPISSYPAAATAPGGGDPLATVPPAQECATQPDGSPRGDYFRLSQLPQRRADSPFVDGEAAAVALTLVNRKQQHFRIYVSGGSAEAVRRFIARASGCLELLPLPAPLPPAIEPVAFDELLVRAASDATKLSRSGLSAVQRSLDPSGAATLGDVLEARGADPIEVVSDAADAAQAALDAKVAAGALTAAEVAALDLDAILGELADRPNPPFLFTATDLPASPAVWGRTLRAMPRANVHIGMQILTKLNGPAVVWFAFDPPVIKNAVAGYQAKTQKSAWVSTNTQAGSITLRFWWHPTHVLFEGTISSAAGSSGKKSYSSGITHAFDVSVKGVGNNNFYTISGGWVPG